MVAWQAAWYYENIDFSAMPFKMRELSQLIKITSFLSGKELRLKLTNYYGKEELIFDEIYVALTRYDCNSTRRSNLDRFNRLRY